MSDPKPFLRWVGGKARIANKLIFFVPEIGSSNVYYEPFLGAGSLFFRTRPTKAVLGDSNFDLIDCFRRVSERPDLVWRHLRVLAPLQSRHDYLRLRDEFNRSRPSMRRAALFIYLNKTCFNGVWRVNRFGEFNVPYGAKSRPGFPTATSLRIASEALEATKLVAGDFESTLVDAQSGDFAFLDPPYLPLSRTSFFNHYTAERFGGDQHERVALVARELAARGVRVMVTEGDSAEVRKWYKDFHITDMAVRRFVSADSKRLLAREVVITSYAPGTQT